MAIAAGDDRFVDGVISLETAEFREGARRGPE